MKLGHHVPGIMTEGVFFVIEDNFNICDRVKAYDADSALVANRNTEPEMLGIARFVRDQEWAPGGTWVLAFWANDQETGLPLVGEPDGRILKLQEKFDTHARQDPSSDRRRIRMALMMREIRERTERLEKAGAIAEKTVHGWKQARGIKTKIFVPANSAAA